MTERFRLRCEGMIQMGWRGEAILRVREFTGLEVGRNDRSRVAIATGAAGIAKARAGMQRFPYGIQSRSLANGCGLHRSQVASVLGGGTSGFGVDVRPIDCRPRRAGNPDMGGQVIRVRAEQPALLHPRLVGLAVRRQDAPVP
jgi:hypothetical protein